MIEDMLRSIAELCLLFFFIMALLRLYMGRLRFRDYCLGKREEF